MLYKIFLSIILVSLSNVNCLISCDYYIVKKLMIHYKNNKINLYKKILKIDSLEESGDKKLFSGVLTKENTLFSGTIVEEYTDCSSIELNRQNGYFCFYCTDNNYNYKYLEYKKSLLKPLMKPLTIYNKDRFNSLYLENKYKDIIQDKICSDGKSINDVYEIVKVEERIEIEK
jgi:hypothetical protein